MFSCKAHTALAVRVVRDRRADLFRGLDRAGHELAQGGLDHVMAVLDRYLIASSGELPDTPA